VAALLECVPNFSEGRNPATVEALLDSIRAAGACVLDHSLDPDHHRSVITFAGSPDAILEAAVAAAGKAADLIDLRRHKGVHPRIGALDVLPFVPIRGISLTECAGLAVRAAERIWDLHRVPAFLYEAAARLPERTNLAAIRRHPPGKPDIGDALHPTAGAVAIGARNFLIAYNVNLTGGSLAAARRIAARVRESSGGLPCVKALGLPLASRGLLQVSMNLTNFEVTPMHAAFHAVNSAAEKEGMQIVESELIGLIPRRAWEFSAAYELKLSRTDPDAIILENRIAALK